MAQAIWNLRDVFKANGRTLTLLTTPGAVLPDELTQDVLVLDEPLPAVEDLTRILEETMAAAEVPELETDASGKAVDALLGLAAFPAEQVLAMSLSKKGLRGSARHRLPRRDREGLRRNRYGPVRREDRTHRHGPGLDAGSEC